MADNINRLIEENIAVKSNCKKFVNEVDYLRQVDDKKNMIIFTHWKRLYDAGVDMGIVEDMAWEMCESTTPTYKTVQSSVIGVGSKIQKKIFEGRTYTNKKGETKKTETQEVWCHFTQDGQYIRQLLPTEEHIPITYPVMVRIQRAYADFNKDAFKVGILSLCGAFKIDEEKLSAFAKEQHINTRKTKATDMKTLRKRPTVVK